MTIGIRDVRFLVMEDVSEIAKCGRNPAGTHQDLKTGLNRVLIIMEDIITKIDNNIARQVQISRQSQANLDQFRNKYLENKKNQMIFGKLYSKKCL